MTWRIDFIRHIQREDHCSAITLLFEQVVRLEALEERFTKLEKNMADQTEQLTADIAALQQAETDTKTRVGAAVAALQAQIDDLKSHPASPDLTAQIAALEATTADLATIAPAPTPPAS